MPWLNPARLPTKPPKPPLPMQAAIDQILHVLRSLPSRHDRHRTLGYVLSSLVESEHIKGLSEVMQVAMLEVNRYNYTDR